MRIQTFHIHPYEIPLANGQTRSGLLICITDEKENRGWGEIAPLPKWSTETLEEALKQLYPDQIQQDISNIHWTAQNCFHQLAQLKLLPSVSFGLESALLSVLAPLPEFFIPTSALLMGSPEEILDQAKLRYNEGYTSAKLKVSNLSLEEAAHLIDALKDKFRLRLDVNRAWNTADSLRFFAQFPLETFDYVEEPFQDPHDLAQFPHPLAVDESFPQDLSLRQLEQLPTLKALVYKPTIQGGMLGCIPLHEWTAKRGISLVLSSSFESDLGLAHIASIAHRLSMTAPIGIGTYHYLKDYVCTIPLRFSHSIVHIPAQISSNIKFSRLDLLRN
jgi:O-succinylbenzoate synthase